MLQVNMNKIKIECKINWLNDEIIFKRGCLNIKKRKIIDHLTNWN
jgi:hypothetical protein